MIAYHYTPAWHAPSILRGGLRVVYSQGFLPGIWLATSCRWLWARAHISRHHGIKPDDLACLCVTVPRHWLTRRRSGVWVCGRDIPPCRILGVSL